MIKKIKMGSDLTNANERFFFNRIASEYIKKDYCKTSQYARKFQLFSLFDIIFSFLQKDKFDCVVELGCGSGAASKYLNMHYTNYIGIDYSDEFISYAKNTYGKENIQFNCMNINDLHMKTNNAEVVFGIGVLHHLHDINSVLDTIKEMGNSSTIFGFIEPQASNPIIQLLRKIRKIVDKNYSKDQVFFTRKNIKILFNNHGFEIKRMKYTGYFSTPFAQIVFKPDWLFFPLIRFFVSTDKIIQSYFPNSMSWNICWIAQKKRC